MTKLEDNTSRLKAQQMSIADADAVFATIAELEIKKAELSAHYDNQLNALKQEQAEALAPLNEELAPQIELLTEYVNAHPDRFEKPRTRKTPHGKYGFQKVTKVDIDEGKTAEIVAFSNERGLGLYEIAEKLNKKAISTAIKAGYDIPGASVLIGDQASYTVDFSYRAGADA